jgi:hypothetical protein
MVTVGEAMADSHVRVLPTAIADAGETLQILAAMEWPHAREFGGCGVNLGAKPDALLALA